MKKRVTKSVAKGMKAALDVVLQTEANTASCIIMYQPKAPKELMNYNRLGRWILVLIIMDYMCSKISFNKQSYNNYVA